MRKTKKTLSLLLALAMVLTLFAGVVQASANVSIGSSVATVLPGDDKLVGRIDIASAAQPAVGAGDVTVVTVTLPSGVTWDANIATTTVPSTTAAFATPMSTRVDGQVLRVTLTNTPPTSTPSIRIEGLIVDVGADFRGDVNATVVVRAETAAPASSFIWDQSATVRIATVAAAGTTATAGTPTVVERGVDGQSVARIDIAENIADSLTAPTTTITLEAPAGVTFTTATASVHAGAAGLTSVTSTVLNRLIIINVTSTAGTPPASTIRIDGIRVRVEPTVADGPINVTVSGGGVTSAAVTVANVGAAGVVTPSARNVPTVARTAGQLDLAIADIRFTENVTDAFRIGRILTFALPTGFTWFTAPTIGWASSASLSTDGRTLTYWTTLDPIATGSTVDVTGFKINTRIDAPVGDIVVTVGGTAGASGTVVVGTLRRPVTVTAVTVPNIKADGRGQALGNLVITEVFAGAIGAGNLTVTLPVGLAFDGQPTVTVTDVAGTEPAVTRNADGRTLTITTTAATAPINATTITISGMRVNYDRTIRPIYGPFAVTVGGTAVLEAGTSTISGVTLTNATAVGADIATVDVANVVSATARTTVFTVDSTAFTVDGVAQPALVVAPFIQAGRTLVPLRAAANAVGVTDDNIIFDPATRTVTLMTNERIAQFTLGSRVVLINGMPLTMDVAPVIVQGRSMLSAGWVTRIFGGTAQWNAAARTVTVTAR